MSVENTSFFSKRDHYTTKDAQLRLKMLVKDFYSVSPQGNRVLHWFWLTMIARLSSEFDSFPFGMQVWNRSNICWRRTVHSWSALCIFNSCNWPCCVFTIAIYYLIFLVSSSSEVFAYKDKLIKLNNVHLSLDIYLIKEFILHMCWYQSILCLSFLGQLCFQTRLTIAHLESLHINQVITVCKGIFPFCSLLEKVPKSLK